MLPMVLVIAGFGFLFMPELAPVAVLCWIGAFIGMREDKNRDAAYERAEAVGFDMSGDRRGDMVFDWVMALLFLLPAIVYFFGGAGQ